MNEWQYWTTKLWQFSGAVQLTSSDSCQVLFFVLSIRRIKLDNHRRSWREGQRENSSLPLHLIFSFSNSAYVKNSACHHWNRWRV